MHRFDVTDHAIARQFAREFGFDPLESASRRDRFRHGLNATSQVHDLPARLHAIAEHMRVGETRFYRDGGQLETAFASLPQQQPGRTLKILSAGCATGEETYTLALMAQLRGLDVCVFGFDRSKVAIGVAQAADYGAQAFAHLPQQLRALCGRGLPETVRSRVRFAVGDIRSPSGELFGREGLFDLIICRNVLLYLAPDQALEAVETLGRSLCAQGILVVARAETAIARRSTLTATEGAHVTFCRAPEPGALTGDEVRRIEIVRGDALRIAREGRAWLQARALEVFTQTDLDEPTQRALARFEQAAAALDVHLTIRTFATRLG